MSIEGNSDVSFQLKKIIDHLGFLEKKIDQILAQSSQKPTGFVASGNRPYRPSFGNSARPPFRPANRAPGGFRGGHDQGRPQGPHGTRSFHRRPTPHQASHRPAPHQAAAR